jgi:hypothetical protein
MVVAMRRAAGDHSSLAPRHAPHDSSGEIKSIENAVAIHGELPGGADVRGRSRSIRVSQQRSDACAVAGDRVDCARAEIDSPYSVVARISHIKKVGIGRIEGQSQRPGKCCLQSTSAIAAKPCKSRAGNRRGLPRHRIEFENTVERTGREIENAVRGIVGNLAHFAGAGDVADRAVQLRHGGRPAARDGCDVGWRGLLSENRSDESGKDD